MDLTEIIEVLLVVLVVIEIIGLYFNIRATKTHEKELNEHLQKLEQAAKELDKYSNCVNQLDEHVRKLEKVLEKTNSGKS